ncbi:MAG: helix-turn-helix domain-containing protein [Crocinitomicaceae bacterium]
MITKPFELTDPTLKKCIHFYYFAKPEYAGENETYAAFPNIYSYLTFQTVSEGVDYQYDSYLNQKFVSFLISSFKQPIVTKTKFLIDEVTIVFKPLGINSFLTKPVNLYKDEYAKLYIPYPDYPKDLIEILSIANENLRCMALEKHLLNIYKPFTHPFLPGIIEDLDNNHEVTFEEISDKYKVTQKTIIQHFKYYLGRTPANYRTILRFRKAYDFFQKNKAVHNLTNLAHLFGYFDQSHLIKDFISITGHKPKDFFKKISTSEKGDINWMFL